MLTPSQLKLYELLKTDEQVKKLIWWKEYYRVENQSKWYCFEWTLEECKEYESKLKPRWFFISKKYTKKLLPLSEHFIRLYCENKKITCTFNRNEIMIWTFYPKNTMTIIVTDYEKDFNSQSDEVYNSICEALNTL